MISDKVIKAAMAKLRASGNVSSDPRAWNTRLTAEAMLAAAAPSEPGVVRMGGSGFILSEGTRWVEDGLHIIESTEFDISAQDPDPIAVLDVFAQNMVDVYEALYDLDQRGGATELEREELARISHRLNELLSEAKARASEGEGTDG